MGRALVLDTGFATNPGASFTQVTNALNSTFTVRNFALTDQANILHLWRKGTASGSLRLRSTKLSDSTQGIRYACAAGLDAFLVDEEVFQQLYPQDTLIAEVTGGAAEVDAMAMLTEYTNLPGITQRLHMPGDLSSVIKFVTTWVINATSSATAGQWQNTIITNLYDESWANTDYAILGYHVDTAVTAVAVNGVETGNSYIGGPGDPVGFRTRNYFADLSLMTGRPCLPLINSANKGNINIGVADTGVSTAVNVTLVVAVLSQNITP